MTYLDSVQEGFAMDDLGNRTGSVTQRDGVHTYAADSLTNRYTAIDANSLAYDDAGNLTTDKDGYHTVYDYENRPVRIYKLNGQTQVTVATLDYDALGRRIRKVDSIANTASLYYYSDNWQVLAEYNGSGTVQKTFVFGNYIDEVLVMTNYPPLTTNDYYYLHDHLYSPAALLDNSGSVVERYEYDAYGTVRILSTNYELRNNSSFGNFVAFTGRELDNLDNGSLKKMHYRHRDYSMFMGRFYQEDPMQYVDGLNLYEYVRSNGLKRIDSLGLCGECTPPSDGFPNAYYQKVLEFAKMPGISSPGNFTRGINGVDNMDTLGDIVDILTIGIWIKLKDPKELAQALIEFGYGETYGDVEPIVEQLLKLREELINSDWRNGYILWMNLEYKTCIPCNKNSHNKCGGYWDTKQKWIPCASRVINVPGIPSTISGSIPKPNSNSDYTTGQAISDAMSYCRFVAEDPENAPTKLESELWGRPDLIKKDREDRRRRGRQ